MKHLILSLFLALISAASYSQELVDTYTSIVQLDDSTFQVQDSLVHEYSTVFKGVEYSYTTTSLDIESIALFDSVGIIDYLFKLGYNEQQKQAAIAARNFEVYSTHRHLNEISDLINTISNGESDYYEEASKYIKDDLVGRYKIKVDSAGTDVIFFAEMILVTNNAHPDGKIMRLKREDNDDQWNVQPFHRWKLKLLNWPYGDPILVWNRKSDERPIYRPDSYGTRDDYNTLVKIE